MIGFMAHRFMDANVQALVGAGPGERSETRENWRNGYIATCRADARWHGAAEDPEDAFGQLLSGVPGAAPLPEKAMAAVIQEAYVQGLSTRSVDELVKTLGMTGISKS